MAGDLNPCSVASDFREIGVPILSSKTEVCQLSYDILQSKVIKRSVR